MERDRSAMESGAAGTPLRPLGAWPARLVGMLLLGTLLLLGYLVVENFIVPLLWAAILAYVTWPLNCRVRGAFSGRAGLAALAMTMVLSLVIIMPLLLLLASLREELTDTFEGLRAVLVGGAKTLPGWLLQIPWLGERIGDYADRIAADPETFGEWLAERAAGFAGEAVGVVGVVGRNATKLAFALLAVFFIYRDGEALLGEVRMGLRRLLGEPSDAYWTAAAGMTRAVVYGLVLTAIAQGVLAGLGYWAVGVESPVLLGVVTALFALVPFGAPVVWGAVTLYLFWHGSFWSGAALLLWGAIAVSSIDNLIRPLVISASARIPFLVVLFGVLGGLSAFGLVGLFLGPVVLAVLLAVWRYWLEKSEPVVS